MELYKRLLTFTYPYWKWIIFALISMVIISGAEGALAWLVKPVLDEVFIKKNTHALQVLPLALIGIMLVKGVFSFFSSYLVVKLGLRITTEFRSLLFKHIHSLSLGFFKNSSTGILISRITNDVAIIQAAVSHVVVDLVKDVLTALILLGLVFYRDWELTLYSLIALPGSFLFLYKVGKKLRKLSHQGQESMAELTTTLYETFSGARIVKAFNAEGRETKRFDKENELFYRLNKKLTKYRVITSPAMEIVSALGMALVIWYGGSKVIQGQSTPGNFFSFLAAMGMMYSPIRRLSRINATVQQALAAAGRVFEVLDLKPEIVDKANAIEIKDFTNAIVYKGVNFGYGSQTILKDIDLTVKKGEVVALVGVSGVGKSSLVDLIPRFHDVTSGSIEIDEIDIRDLKVTSLRRLIGLVTQDVILFNDTVFNNIAYGSENASRQEIEGAAIAAFAHDFIMDMPDKYDTAIGEKGVKLSGGQKQRLAIARAILKDPAILILDEATSALDAESELIVQQALQNLMKNRTTIVVAHRLSTIVRADKIVVMEGGRIADIGCHDDLLLRSEIYQRLYRLNFDHVSQAAP